ncbi:MAG: FkbM family methyltransferase, partial [Rhodanobacter sp.]
MGKSATWLLDHQASTYSQSGEDGIIGKILETLPERDHWCVEFGALDGTSLSNTRNLIEHADYSAVLIEASKVRFKELEANYVHTENVTTLNRFVGFSPNDNLDHILADTAIPQDFDFLSIDIDGNDYHVWKSTSRFVPKVVCIEFNHTIPNEVKFIQPPDPQIAQGSSLSALVDLGKIKSYELVCVEGVNAFFVRSEYFSLFEIDDNSVPVLRTDLSAVTWLFIGYDGTIFLDGRRAMPWHAKLPLKAQGMQRLPKFLRKFS